MAQCKIRQYAQCKIRQYKWWFIDTSKIMRMIKQVEPEFREIDVNYTFAER